MKSQTQYNRKRRKLYLLYTDLRTNFVFSVLPAPDSPDTMIDWLIFKTFMSRKALSARTKCIVISNTLMLQQSQLTEAIYFKYTSERSDSQLYNGIAVLVFTLTVPSPALPSTFFKQIFKGVVQHFN